MSEKVTMQDIARSLGVSTVTVSKALSGKDGVSDKVRAQIEEAARNMGYSYKKSETRDFCIGVVVSGKFGFSDNTFYSNLYRELVLKAGAKGCTCMMEIVAQEDESSCALPQVITGGRADGVIILGQMERAYIENIAKTQIPFVLLDFYDETYPVDSVASDGMHGTYLLTEHLIERGHRNIAFVGSVNATSSILDRYLGYCKALIKHSMSVGDSVIIKDRDDRGRFVELDIPDTLPDAFVCNCDETALALVGRLRERGYDVPKDVSVVGFDDSSFAKLCFPQLTTYRVNIEKMAETAIGLLRRKMSGKKYIGGNTVIAGNIIERGSVADRR
ncbi:MAG: LacI family DNA-binding transcriptional regulator [Clostridia bacterium]|nr:LacI family transcriptional regulator [Oscillospiraceae bacterium]MBQ6797443.1 LacI family DNA-binding transcriptional regulator [Clostridia bacterium]